MIEINQLTKVFDKQAVVDDVTFQVAPGEVLGFLGPNGAGKSTTMKMLTGFLKPDAGEVRIQGLDLSTSAREAQAKIGYLPEGAPAYGDMTVIDFLRFIAEVRGFSGQDKDQRVASVIEQVELGRVQNQTIDTLSKGFKRRVGLAQAIIHDPEVLVLDEPTDGLDPNQKHQVRSLIKNLSADKMVIISTHILEEVSAVCSRAIILANGRIAFDGTPNELAARSPRHNAVYLQAPDITDEHIKALSALTDVVSVESDGDDAYVILADSGAMILPAIHAYLNDNACAFTSLHSEPGRLDDVFRDMTGNEGEHNHA